MSSAGVTVAIPQSYFCYQCNRTVTLTPSPNTDLCCPNCSGGFLEEYDSPSFQNPNPNPNPLPEIISSLLFGSGSDPFGPRSTSGPLIITSSSSSIDFGNPRNFSATFTSRSSDDFNPLTFLQGYLSPRGSNFQVILENHPGDPNFTLPTNIGDYFLGPGLEQLIQQLAENDPNRYGTPPASKQAVEGLPDVVITDEIMKSDFNSCAVCMNDFEIGSTTKQMPCKHLYHSDCLLPWLQLHNSCPVCRFELPTDDQEYENRRANGGQGGSSESGGGSRGGDGGSQGGGDNGGRRFSISFPWHLFGAFRGNNDRNNSGPGSGAQEGGGDGGSQPNEESRD